MGKITNEMVKFAYQTAATVYRGEVGRTDGALNVARSTGMDAGSAGDYITAFLSMMNGICYKRTINLFATEYYLEHIGSDFGRAAQKAAAQATVEHVQYYQTKHCYLASTDKLAHRYL